MSGSLIPATLTALVGLWSTAAASAALPLSVIDGPVYDPPEKFLAVGWDRSDSPSVVAQRQPANLSASVGYESFDVSSLLSFAHDASDVAAVRGDVFAAFGVFDAALVADVTLGGLVMQAFTTEFDVTQIFTEAGAVMDLRFTTHVEAMR